jgi:hypothetical protein
MAKRALLKTRSLITFSGVRTGQFCGFSSRLREKRCMERKASLSG